MNLNTFSTKYQQNTDLHSFLDGKQQNYISIPCDFFMLFILLKEKVQTYRILRFFSPEKSTLVILVMLFRFKSLQRETGKLNISLELQVGHQYPAVDGNSTPSIFHAEVIKSSSV